MLLGPSLANFGNKLVLGSAHLADQRLVAGFFVARGPKDHFREDGGEVNSFWRKGIEHFSAVLGVFSGPDDSVGFEAAEAVGQNVAGDFFVGMQKFVKRFVAAEASCRAGSCNLQVRLADCPERL